MKKDEPVHLSWLDGQDYYKMPMGAFIHKRYAGTKVTFAMNNRTKGVRLAELVSEGRLREELTHYKSLRPTAEEIDYIGSLKGNVTGRFLYRGAFQDHLRQLRMPDYHLEKRDDGQFNLNFDDAWENVTYWETAALSIMNRLASAEIYRIDSGGSDIENAYLEGERRLRAKIELIKKHPRLMFMEFGLRRSFSRIWQDRLVEILATELPPGHLVGVSTLSLAKKYNLTARGSMAHELFMVLASLAAHCEGELRASHGKMLREWFEDYGPDLLIALTDTFGTEFFFKDFTEEQLRAWSGLRQDSGDARTFAVNQIAQYGKFEIDPKTKLFVPSDGLDIDLIIKLFIEFCDQIGIIFGWGTSLTNDVGIRNLSIVIKAVMANGRGTVKLSDNLAKATGSDENKRLYVNTFGYTNTKSMECVR